MDGLRLEPLRTLDAQEYWSVYVRGRTDLPTRSVTSFVDRYLSLAADEQRRHFAIRKGETMIGTVRLLPDEITGFSLAPDHMGDARAVLIKIIDVLRSRGAAAITASLDEAYLRDFEALGFHRLFARMRMEAETKRSPPGSVPLKPPEEAEIPGLTRFFMDVYAGHLEQQYGMHVGSEEDWRRYITGILRGETGRFMPDASFVSLEGERLTGAILVTHWMGSPLISELGVAADLRRRGFGRALVSAASTRLAALDEPRWALYVTLGNEPAIALYHALGFAPSGNPTVTARLDASS